MVMKAEPIRRALDSVEKADGRYSVILLSPQGERFEQSRAWALSRFDQLILICGRYEGVDERIRMKCVDLELSIGDYILTGGELGAMVIIDAVSRLIPGVLGSEGSTREESFEENLLEYPHYTRPRIFKGEAVPEILLSGDHEKIRVWRRTQSLQRTLTRRPDLIEKAVLTEEDKAILKELRQKGRT
jgi:tRNA (guanine37-N1)-methyltransferase